MACGVRLTIGVDGLVAIIVHVGHVAAEAEVGRVSLVAAFEGEGNHSTAALREDKVERYVDRGCSTVKVGLSRDQAALRHVDEVGITRTLG